MPDRLAQLHRQRALLLEHVAWLEAEIARENPSALSPVARPAEPVPAAAVMPSDQTLPDFNPAGVHQDVKRGCWIYFSAALLLLALGTLALYFVVTRR
jgi:hypothetical protein